MPEKPETEIQKAPPAVPKRIEAPEGSIKKKPFWKRVRDTFFVEDCASIAKHVWKKIIVPSIQKLIDESATQAIHRAVYGDNAPDWRTGARTHAENSSVYAGRAAANRGYSNYNRANRYNSILEGSLFAYREVPDEIIDEAIDWIASYGFISVETFNQMLPPQLSFDTVHTDGDWGWYSLTKNCVVAVPGGWTIDLPPAKPRH